ncbi:hypothetical protein POSPLADRAFT_1047329 [Postia placenta MAD-698-R-SB12]|uniref:WW domain-containing protein n=1 Tax=Postia placenta MAD-698-R-SB12 TaxID=670580 RepID=A0A1X6MXG3_9APHY|nr:hypothetical protein POSPLADRAFT_1047329 [Postia placenta MAD-698-R-SB12]OSX61051.1 hypothetical protein POSPLADRAFT_1047329 [Postia placenta MAD-698-R-SB12]
MPPPEAPLPQPQARPQRSNFNAQNTVSRLQSSTSNGNQSATTKNASVGSSGSSSTTSGYGGSRAPTPSLGGFNFPPGVSPRSNGAPTAPARHSGQGSGSGIGLKRNADAMQGQPNPASRRSVQGMGLAPHSGGGWSGQGGQGGQRREPLAALELGGAPPCIVAFRTYLVGRDLEGNRFYEYPSVSDDPRRTKRVVKYKHAEHVWDYASMQKQLAGVSSLNSVAPLGPDIAWSLTSTMGCLVDAYSSPSTCAGAPFHIQELQADLERQRRVQMNAALIEARDREERLQQIAAAQDTPVHQVSAPNASVSLQRDTTIQEPPLRPARAEGGSPRGRPETHSHTEDPWKKASHTSDEPQAWAPKALFTIGVSHEGDPAMPSTHRLPLVWQLFRLLLSSPSGAIRATRERLLWLWLFVKRYIRRLGWGNYGKTRPDNRKQVDRDTRVDEDVRSGVVEAGNGSEIERAVIYCSKEPVNSHLGLHIEHNGNSPRLLSTRDIPSRPASRPVSAAYPDSVGFDGEPYSISVQNASQSSIDIGLATLSDHGIHHRDTRYDHLALSSRPSSRTSSPRRRDRGVLRDVSGPTSSRALARSKSRARSRARDSLAGSHRGSRLSIASFPPEHKSPALSALNQALPAGNIPIHVPLEPARSQKMYAILQIKRYLKGQKIDDLESNYVVKPLQLLYPHDDVPAGWTALTHPEGACYFYHEEKRIYTDAYIMEPEIMTEIDDFIANLEYMAHGLGFQMGPNMELVLELEDNDRPHIPTKYHWCYYFVDNDTRTLFWLQEFEIYDETPWDELQGLNTASHISALHWDMFPYKHDPSKALVNELLSIIVHSTADQLTSTTSTIPYHADELHKMMTIVKNAKAMSLPKNRISTLPLAHQRFLHYHGQKAARLSRDQSVFDKGDEHRTLLITVLAPLLFNAPDVHLKALEKIWIDNIITIIPWSHFMSKLQTDWQEYVLFATVLLNANISFMTINDVDPGSGPRTAAQIASFVSTIASIGSTVIGLLLIRQYRLKPKDTAQDALNYLASRRHPTLGLETLAIMYSLPYALLMWGMVTFLIAFAFECFETADKPSIIVSGVSWGLVGILIAWCIYTSWEGGETSIREWILSHWDTFYATMSEKGLWPKAWLFRRQHVATPQVEEMGFSLP